MICEAKQEDIPFLLSLALECYPSFDAISAGKWLKNWIEKPEILCLKGNHSAALSFIHAPFWSPQEKDCELNFICSRKTSFGAVELLNILKISDTLRKERGCQRYFWNSRLADLTPFAKRLGAEPVGQMWVLK